MTWQNIVSILKSALLFDLGLLCYNQLCSDKVLLMKWCVLLLFMNNIFSDLNPRVNISLAGEIFPLQLVPFVGKFERKAMAPSRKIVSTAESYEDHSLRGANSQNDGYSGSICSAGCSSTQGVEEARVEFTAKIAEL